MVQIYEYVKILCIKENTHQNLYNTLNMTQKKYNMIRKEILNTNTPGLIIAIKNLKRFLISKLQLPRIEKKKVTNFDFSEYFKWNGLGPRSN